jgi:hypothetical protein
MYSEVQANYQMLTVSVVSVEKYANFNAYLGKHIVTYLRYAGAPPSTAVTWQRFPL